MKPILAAAAALPWLFAASGSIDAACPGPRVARTIDLGGRVMHAPVGESAVRANDGATCVTNGVIKGPAPLDTPWHWMKEHPRVGNGYDKDGVRFGNNAAGVVHKMSFINTMDAISTAQASTWWVQSSYIAGNHDDAIENDQCHPGTVIDTLVDGTHMGISMRRGHRAVNRTCSAPIAIANSLIHLKCGPYTQDQGGHQDSASCGPRQGVGSLFKTGPGGPTVRMSDTIVLIDDQNEGGEGQMDLPRGNYRNVTVIWDEPGAYPGNVPPGVRVTRDKRVWNRERAMWLARHGCPASGCVGTPPR